MQNPFSNPAFSMANLTAAINPDFPIEQFMTNWQV